MHCMVRDFLYYSDLLQTCQNSQISRLILLSLTPGNLLHNPGFPYVTLIALCDRDQEPSGGRLIIIIILIYRSHVHDGIIFDAHVRVNYTDTVFA